MRTEVQDLLALGRMPSETADDAPWEVWEASAHLLHEPATDDEARALLSVFPEDGSGFGLAWAVLTFIETAPGWPLWDALDDRSEWVQFLRERAERGSG